jgi:hypothetical protein
LTLSRSLATVKRLESNGGADCRKARHGRCNFDPRREPGEDRQMLRGTDWDDAMEPCGRREVTRTTAGAARRAAAAPATQTSRSETSAPAVPARTCSAYEIPANPVGTTPLTRQSPISPMATLIPSILPASIPQSQCQDVVIARLTSMFAKSRRS